MASLAVTAAVGVGADAASGGHPSPAVAARHLRADEKTASQGVTLVTGDSVRVRKNALGGTIVEALPRAGYGSGPQFQTITTPRRTYVIPADARPYLGSVLDPALFDVTALTGAGTRSHIPVRVSFAGTSAPSVPGVTVTSTSRGALTGYLTPSSAHRFGAALARRYRADAKANFPSRRTLFGATRIASGLAAPPVVTPDYPMRTLIIKAVGQSGAPAHFAFLTVYDTDDFATFVGFAEIVRGEARLSVPVGTYGMDAGFDRSTAGNKNPGFAVVTKSDVAVSAQNQVVTLDARTATSRLRVRTPKPADQQTAAFDILRTDGTGNGSLDDGYAVGSGSIYVAPAAKPASGTLTSSASWNLTGTPLSNDAYTYSLHFPAATGIPADQSYEVSTDDLATLHSRYYVDSVPRAGSLSVLPILPGSDGGTSFSFPVALPSNTDIYLNAIPGAVYFTSMFASPDPDDNPFAAVVDDAPRLAPAGTTLTADWARGPALPQVPVETNGYAASFGFDCPSCRTSTKLQIGLDFADDTTPGQAWELDGRANGKPVAHLRIYRNGTTLADKSDRGLTSVPVTAGPATYRVVDEVDRAPSAALQSVRTYTDITFQSSGGKGGPLPATWTCSLGKVCTVLPMLRAAVTLPVNLVGSVPVGSSSIGLQIAHIQGAPTTAITSGSVEVRVPGGSWRTLPSKSLGNGAYSATLTTTSAEAGSSLDLRVTGTDAAGGRIVQTAIAAFAVSGS